MNPLSEKNKTLFSNIEVDAVFLRTREDLPDSNVSYFTGLTKQFLSNHALILKPKAKPLLLKSILEPAVKIPALRVKRIDRRKQFKTVLKKELKGVKKIGINKPLYSSAFLREIKKIADKKKLVDVSSAMASQRATKSMYDVLNIATACKIVESVAEKIPRFFKKGMTEKQLALKIEILLREKGEDILPFPVIVASGKNAAFPHHVPLDKKIKNGLVLFDFGCYYKNYCSDISRVFSVGKPTKKQKQLYAGVFATKQYSQALVKPGVVCGQLFDKADKFLKKQTGISLIHGLGHGLGVDAHDFPSGFLHGNKKKLEPGMVLTVEPGIYGKFGGIRIEDDVVVTSAGCKQLTKAPTELLLL